MADTAVPSVANFDVAGAADRVVAFAREIINSQSAMQAEFNVSDRTRALSYLSRLTDFIGVTSKPDNPLDLPKTYPTAYPCAPFPDDGKINGIENAVVRDVVRRFKAAHQELMGSQSKDRSSGWFAPDKTRLAALIENTQGMIAFGETSVDLPENPGNVNPLAPVAS